MHFAFRDALSAAFGWGTIPGAAILVVVAGAFGLKMSAETAGQTMLFALAAAGAAGLIAFLVNLLAFAPRKAWLAMNPLLLVVERQISDFTMVQTNLQRHLVYVTIRNRSPATSVYCTISVAEVKNRHGVPLPWQIYSSNIPANDEHMVPLAQWFYWEIEREDDNILILNERSSTFASANMIQIPAGADLSILARSPSCPDKEVWCRVRVEQKRLVLEKINT
jgi:hypothetical protein